MSNRNPARQYKNRHMGREGTEKDMLSTLFFTPPTTTSKIQSRSELILNHSEEEVSHPFFTPDQSTVKHDPLREKQPDIHSYCTKIVRSSSEASMDSAKRLIYENRTIQHNYSRLKDEYCKEEEQHNRLKSAVTALREKYELLTKGLKNRPRIPEAPQREEVPEMPTPRINPKLMRKNTNALVKIAEMKFTTKLTHHTSRQSENDAIQRLQQLLQSERRQCDELTGKNERLRNQLHDIRQKNSKNYTQPEYIAKITKLQGENRDLQQIIKGMSEVLKTDVKLFSRH